MLGHVITIAEEGSISAAARRLRLSQPTLSRQLRDLEQRLGVELFARSGRGLTPTAAGEALVQRAMRVLAEAESVLDDVVQAAQGKTGRLTVAFAGSAINGPLGKALGRFRTDLPDVDLRLVEVFDDVGMSAGVLDGSFDVAVQRLPVYDARLTSQLWIREPLTLYLPTGHRLATTGDIATTVLGDIPLVLWPRESSPRAYDEVLALCHHAGVVPRIAAHGRTVQTILALVAAGFGAAVMAHSYQVLRRDGVTARPLAGTLTNLHLIWQTTNANPALTPFLAVALQTPVPAHRGIPKSTDPRLA